MNRRDALLTIAESFEDDFVVSVEPDLPELFEGPDVLAGKSGRLIAVFVPKSSEISHPERLRTRLVLSRLALPDHVQCLLALDEMDDASHVEQLEHDFHAVVSLTDRAGLRRLRTKAQEHRHVPSSTRQMVERRSAFLLSMSLEHQPWLTAMPTLTNEDWGSLDDLPLRSSVNGTGHTSGVSLPPWPLPLLTQSTLHPARGLNVRVFNGVLVGGETRVARSIRERMLPYVTFAAQSAFRIDNGVPYLGHPTAGVFITPSGTWRHIDPLKPVRAAAFAGWALLTDPSERMIRETVKETSEWLVRTVSERVRTSNQRHAKHHRRKSYTNFRGAHRDPRTR